MAQYSMISISKIFYMFHHYHLLVEEPLDPTKKKKKIGRKLIDFRLNCNKILDPLILTFLSLDAQKRLRTVYSIQSYTNLQLTSIRINLNFQIMFDHHYR